MKYVKLSIIVSILTFVSCDDGDIVVSNFEFESDNVEFCYSDNSNETVFYNENENQEVFYITIDGEYDTVDEAETEFNIPDEAIVKSVKFSDIDTGTFFCNAVASEASIENEVVGTSGMVTITTAELIDIEEGDDDNDGLTNEEEGYDSSEDELHQDTDGDSIPDFRDEDDDNDDIQTSIEISDGVLEEGETLEEGEYPDTDGDGTPNYLDTDDDGDEILSRYEYNEGTSGPSDGSNNNDDGLGAYLDSDTLLDIRETDATATVTTLNNSYTTNYITAIKIENLLADSVIYDETTSIGEFEESAVTSEIIRIDEDGSVIEIIDTEDNSPIAIITTSAITGTAPLTVTFDASTSLDPNGAGLDYFWDFGEGSSSNATEVENTFSNSGTYIVILEVIDENGNSDRDTVTITVN